MDNTFIYRELISEFNKKLSKNETFSAIQVQRASWKFGVYPSTSQILEIRSCQQHEDSLVGIEFYQFCLLIATIRHEIDNKSHSFKIKPQGALAPNQKSRWDVFLGGACNPTTWRLDVAIPFLKEKNITFYNPQVSQWDPSLIEIESLAKESARVLLFVLDLNRTRGIASLVEAAYLSGQGRNLILVVPRDNPTTVKETAMKDLNENEFQSLNRSYLFIDYLVQKQGIPLFNNVQDALKATRICLISKSMIQDLTDIDGVVPVKHSFVNVSRAVRTLQMVFQSLDTSRSGSISQKDVMHGFKNLFNEDVSLISVKKPTFTFPDFCVEYSIILLTLLQHQREQRRSNSDANFKARYSSLDNFESLEREMSLKSSINIKQPIDLVCVCEHNESESGEISALCNCFKGNRKFAYCLIRFVKCPFRRSAVKPLKQNEIAPSIESIKIEPQLLISEEKYDVYLGGTCGNSNWREKIAIPLLKRANCKYYDPNMHESDWSRKLLPLEAEARERSKVLVYVITNECTSTATLVEVAHFIGQGKKIIMFVQMLTNIIGSPPVSPMNQFLQSSCSFPLSSINLNDNHSFFSSIQTAESTTTGYQSNSNTNSNTSQFSLPPLSHKLSTSDSSQLGRNKDNCDLAISINNLSKFNLLSDDARMDHNRGRKYLIDLALKAKVPILPSIDETILHAIEWSHRGSPSHVWTNKSNS